MVQRIEARTGHPRQRKKGPGGAFRCPRACRAAVRPERASSPAPKRKTQRKLRLFFLVQRIEARTGHPRQRKKGPGGAFRCPRACRAAVRPERASSPAPKRKTQRKLRLFFLIQRIEARTGHPLYRFSAVRPVALVGADAERSCSRRRSVTDAACPSRVLIGPLARFEIHLYTRRGGRLCPLKGPLYQEGAVCAPRRLGEFLNPFFSFSSRKKRTVSIFQEKKEGCAKPEVQTVPPSRQKKPAPFRFRRGGENSISAAFFFLPKL